MKIYRCDLCERTYQEYEIQGSSHISMYEQDRTEGYDCCPRCTKFIRSVMSIIQDGDEPIISYR